MTGATIQCLSHSANPAIESGAGRVNRTLVGEVQALCTSTVLDQQTLELARSLELRSGAYHAPALPVELYQRSWRGDSNADHGLTRPALFPLSYTSTKLLSHLEAVGRIALPMICFAGRCLAVLATPPRTYLLTWSGRRDSNPRSRRWQRRVLATRRLPPQKLERAARVELASSGWRPEAPAAIPCSPSHLAGVTGFEPA